MSKLHIPDEAVLAAYRTHHNGIANLADQLAAAGPHIVAAELRRMAAEEDAECARLRDTLRLFDKGPDGIYKAPASVYEQLTLHGAIRNRLLTRADELDGGAQR